MGRKINIEEVRGFLEASNRQFEQGGIYLERALFKRDDDGYFCLSKKDTHHRIGLPFDRLLGWAYEKEG